MLHAIANYTFQVILFVSSVNIQTLRLLQKKLLLLTIKISSKLMTN